ncbi:hypothetical protein BDV10DRAFT_103985 [Aspergillus recurvatus]
MDVSFFERSSPRLSKSSLPGLFILSLSSPPGPQTLHSPLLLYLLRDHPAPSYFKLQRRQNGRYHDSDLSPSRKLGEHVLASEVDHQLQQDNVVPDAFLKDHGLSLIHHESGASDIRKRNLGYELTVPVSVHSLLGRVERVEAAYSEESLAGDGIHGHWLR